MIGGDRVVGLKDIKVLHQSFTPDLRLEVEQIFSLISAPLRGVPASLHGAYKEPKADRTSRLDIIFQIVTALFNPEYKFLMPFMC